MANEIELTASCWYSEAVDLYDQALRVFEPLKVLSPGTAKDFVGEVLEKKAYAHVALNDWFKALLATAQARACCLDISLKSVMLEGLAYGEIGLLEPAARSLESIVEATRAKDGSIEASEFILQAGHDAKAMRARQKALDNGNLGLLQEELAKIQQVLPKKDVREWSEAVQKKCQSKAGQKECVDSGFLLAEWLNDAPAHYTTRAVHRALQYQVKKTLQIRALGVTTFFATPKSLRCDGGRVPMVSEDRWRELQTVGLVVIIAFLEVFFENA